MTGGAPAESGAGVSGSERPAERGVSIHRYGVVGLLDRPVDRASSSTYLLIYLSVTRGHLWGEPYREMSLMSATAHRR